MNDKECAELIFHGAIAKSDADIAGLGVIIAFVFSACITLVAVLAAYFYGLIDDGLLRPVDRLVLRVPSRAAKHTQLHVSLRKVVLTLSDQQIVTGIAILGAGFLGLKSGGISVYHYQIAIYLAWMSSSVHLSALTLLRPFLLYHRGLLLWRIIGMLTLLAMLFIALVPTVSNDWAVVSAESIDSNSSLHNESYTAFGVPAQCFWGQTYGQGVNPDAVLSYLVLLISYVWKIGGLFATVRSTFERWIRNPLDWTLEKLLGHSARQYERRPNFFKLWTFRLCLAIALPLTASLEALGSFSAALWLSTLGLIYGVMQIIIPRQIVHGLVPSLAQSEAQLGFGQMVPLILLIQPFGAATELLWVKGESEEEAVLEDPHWKNAASYTASWDLSEEVRSIPSLPEQPLLQHMATYKTPIIYEQGPQRFQLRAFMYSSKLFHLLVWGSQAATAAIAGTIFWADYETIGYTTTGNWLLIAISVAGWLVLCPLVTLMLAPWSRLGQCHKRQRQSTAKRGTEVNSLHVQAWAAEQRRRSVTEAAMGEGQGQVWASTWQRKSVAPSRTSYDVH